jgi:ABC-type hemin transport system substrate-binding protein
VGTELVLALGHRGRLVAVDAESARLPAAGGLPVTDGRELGALSPDLALAPPAAAEAARRSVPAARLIEIAPHDFDEAWALCLEIGAALGGAEAAHRFVREASRPLAELGSASFGRRRPRVAAVLGVDPLEVAGGHSFLTDLIELAGGESVTHGTEEPRLAWSPGAFAQAGVELVVVVVPQAASMQHRERARSLFGSGVPVEFLVFDPELDLLTGALPATRKLRGWIADLSAAARRDREALAE